MTFARKKLGSQGEDLAKAYLQAQGYKVLDVNFRNKLGELDLVAKDGQVVCFVEVKTRRSLSCGQPYESVNFFKKRKIANMAKSYLKFKFCTVDVLSRFDVVSVYLGASGPARVEHIKNAFECGEIRF